MSASRKAIAKAYVELSDTYSAEQLSAGVAQYLAETRQKVDADLLTRDIGAELLRQKKAVVGTLTVARDETVQEKGAIEAEIARELSAKIVNLDVHVDSTILGGFIVETPVGSFDASVVRILDDLETA